LAQSVITRRIVVAGGVFAPGHLGELTRIVPFEMVDAVLADCGCVQRRVRKLPARVVVYLLLAAALFEQAGYLTVWRKLTGALRGRGRGDGHWGGVVAGPHQAGTGAAAGLVRSAAGKLGRATYERVLVARAAGVRD
jgi:hypothetical protein